VNRRTKRVLPNSVTTTYEYDWRDRLTNIVHKTGGGTLLASAGYVRAAGGEPTRITREDNSYVDLKYDSALRLTNEVFYNAGGVAQSTNGYGYDTSGTRIRLVLAGLPFTNVVQKGFRVTQVKTNGTVAESYGFDNGGRITNIVRGGATNTLGYNTADQVTAVTNGAAWTNYTYDATGRRVKSTDWSGGQRRFLVAPTPDSDLESIHLVADGANNFKQGYVYVGDDPLLRW
jgi:YD repeat-containing protein